MKHLAIALLVMPIAAWAQNSSPGNAPILPLWDAPIPEAQGYYTVSLNSICSVALERYDLEFKGKTYPITELSVETVGGKTARFYYVKESNDDEQQITSAGVVKDTVKTITTGEPIKETEQDKKLRVVKAYPESSTVATVEYRLGTEKKVVDLYHDLRQKWISAAP